MTVSTSRFTPLIQAAQGFTQKKVCAIVHPCDEVSLTAAVQAYEQGIFVPLFVGPQAQIEATAEQFGLKIDGLQIVHSLGEVHSAQLAVELIQNGQAHLLMKGSLHTDVVLTAVLSHNGGLRTKRRLSHVFIYDIPLYSDLLFITDAAINVAPTLKEKADILQNAIDLHIGLGFGEPKAAILSAVEQVTERIPSTLEAAVLCKMADRGQIKGGIVDGPLAMDNAVSPEAARIKKITSPVAGQAQIVLAPNLEAGNILIKSLSFLAGAVAAGVVLGARIPIILTSRADGELTRIASCAAGVVYAHYVDSK